MKYLLEDLKLMESLSYEQALRRAKTILDKSPSKNVDFEVTERDSAWIGNTYGGRDDYYPGNNPSISIKNGKFKYTDGWIGKSNYFNTFEEAFKYMWDELGAVIPDLDYY